MKNYGGGLVAKLCLTLVTPWTIACQAPLSIGFSRQEYWSELPFPSPEDLPDPGIEPRFLHCRQILYQMNYEESLKNYKSQYFWNVDSKAEMGQGTSIGARHENCSQTLKFLLGYG